MNFLTFYIHPNITKIHILFLRRWASIIIRPVLTRFATSGQIVDFLQDSTGNT